jgi:hypothetical protein
MKAIVIDEDMFEQLFTQTLANLKLEYHESKLYQDTAVVMHRKFHFEVCKLKEALINSK